MFLKVEPVPREHPEPFANGGHGAVGVLSARPSRNVARQPSVRYSSLMRSSSRYLVSDFIVFVHGPSGNSASLLFGVLVVSTVEPHPIPDINGAKRPQEPDLLAWQKLSWAL